LFQGRFKSIVVDKDCYFLELTRYIHLNPVHAGIVTDPAAYQWSSYRGYLGKKDAFLDYEEVQRYSGMTPARYQSFVLDGLKKLSDPLKEVYAGFILGSSQFIKDRLSDLKIQLAGEEIANKKVLLDNQEKAERIIRAVEKHYRTTLAEISVSKARPLRVKQLLIYLLREYTGMTNQAVGEIVGMRYPAVSKAGATMKQLLEQDKHIQRTVKKLVYSFQI
jgi:hypothetical protein